MKVGKEVKIGLAVIGVLLCVFAAVAYQKIADDTPPPRAVAEDRPASETAEPSTMLEAGQESEAPGNLNKKGRLAAMLGSGKTTPAAEPFAHKHREPVAKTPPSRTPVAAVDGEPFGGRKSGAGREPFDKRESVDRYSDPGAFASNATAPPKRERISLDASGNTAAASSEPRRLPIADAEERLPAAPPIPPRGRRYGEHRTPEARGDHDPLPAAPKAAGNLPVPPAHTASTESENLIPPLEAQPVAAPATPPRGPRRPRYSANAEPIPTRPQPLEPEVSPTQGIQIPREANASPYANQDQYNLNRTPERVNPKDLNGYEKGSNYRNQVPSQRRHPPVAHSRPEPEPEPEPLPREGNEYTVQPNDSFWVISKRLYGNGGYFKALYEYNKHIYPYPDRIRVGDKLLAPDMAVLEEQYGDLCPQRRHRSAGTARQASLSRGAVPGGRTYKVEKGDTLFDIARYELGKGSRWVEIYDLNRGVLGDDFDHLPPGTELVLPGAAGRHGTRHDRDRVTSQPSRPLR